MLVIGLDHRKERGRRELILHSQVCELHLPMRWYSDTPFLCVRSSLAQLNTPIAGHISNVFDHACQHLPLGSVRRANHSIPHTIKEVVMQDSVLATHSTVCADISQGGSGDMIRTGFSPHLSVGEVMSDFRAPKDSRRLQIMGIIL